MTIQHVDIEDADRHEAKGASGAGSSEALFGVGDGTTEFRAINFSDVEGTPVFSLALATELLSVNTADQNSFAVNTETQVVFGTATTTDNLDLDADGTLTFLSSGTYGISIDLSVGKTSGASGSYIFFMEKVNGVQAGPVRCFFANGGLGTTNWPLSFMTYVQATLGDTYELWMMKTSATIGLVGRAIPTTTGWPVNNETASLRVGIFSGS